MLAVSAREIAQGVGPFTGSSGTRQSEPVLLRQRQGEQQVTSADCNETLGEPLQKNLRSLGILIEERSRGSKQQVVAIAWLSAHRLFGLR
jgi:hypothetical protein